MLKHLVDCHAHVNFEFDQALAEDSEHPLSKLAKDFDSEKVIENAKKNGVVAIINNSTDKKSNRDTLELAKKHEIIKASLGMYPTDGLKLTEQEFDAELDFIKSNKNEIISIGEVGLDYHELEMTAELTKRMKDNFAKFLELASKIKKPIIIHSRKAESDVIDILSSYDVKAQLHSYGGKLKLAKKAIDMGVNFSIPANVNRAENFQKLVEITPMSQLLTETDTPFLSPIKDQLNESSNVIYGVKKIAEIKELNEQETANLIFANYQRIFL